MSNKPLSLSQKDITHIFGSFNLVIRESEFNKARDFLLREYNLSVSCIKPPVYSKAGISSTLKDWAYIQSNGLVSTAQSLLNYLGLTSHQSGETALVLSILTKNPAHYKGEIKKLCSVYRLKPNELILKIFSKYLGKSLLVLLPQEISNFLARVSFNEKCFDPDSSEIIEWLSSTKGEIEESKLASYFNSGVLKSAESKLSKSLENWIRRDYEQTANSLIFVSSLLQKRKLPKSKFCPYFMFIHIVSESHLSLKKSRALLNLYKDLFSESILTKTLDIYLDIKSSKFKKAIKSLDSLHFYHKNFYSDTFFIILCKYWCNGQLSKSELDKLRSLLDEYNYTENSLMKFEVQSLYKEVIGAADLVEDQLLFKHKPFARFLKSDQSVFELLAQEENSETLQKRLIWLVSFDAGSMNQEAWFEVEPATQEKGKSGVWKAPKYIPWKELFTKEIRVLMAAQDKQVLSLLKDARETLGVDYSLPENEALLKLCGAENLYLADDANKKLSFELINPVIEYKELSGKKFINWKFPLNPGSLYIEEVDDDVYEVCVLNKALLNLKNKSLNPLQINNSRDELVDFFKKLPENLIVEGDDNFQKIESEIGSDLIVRVIPTASNTYRLQILAGKHGMTSIPGEGRRILSLKRSNTNLIWERDKDWEKRKADELSQKTGLDFTECILPYEWELSEPRKLLSVLEVLYERKDIHLQWPRGGRIKVSSSSGGKLNVKAAEKRDWFRLEGEIFFGKKAIQLSEVLKSFNGKDRFVEISKNEFLALSNDLKEGLSDLINLSDQRNECLELHAALSDTLSSRLKELPVDIEEDFIFRECVTASIYSKRMEVKIPEGLQAKLRPYQEKGFYWLVRMLNSGIGVCLADDMGLGKTIQTLSMLLHQKSVGPSLIIAPTSLCQNWLIEAEKFTPDLKVKLYRGPNRKSLLNELQAGDLLITSYGLVMQDVDFMKEEDWNTVVLDEAQMVKNSGTLRSKSIKLLQAKSRLALSGTPVENHVGELWNLFDWLNPGLLGTRSYFQNNYALPIEKNIPGKIESLKEKIKPFILRRLKKNVLKELPDSQETIIYVDLNQKEKDIYNASKYLVAKNLNKSKKEKRRQKNKIEILAEISRLRKITSNFELSEIYDDISSKTESVMSKVTELLENGHQALLFSQFTSHLDIIEDCFKDKSFSYTRLDGSMTTSQRQKAIDSFSSGDKRMLLISLKAGGFGLNLTAADFVLHLDPWWNPAVEEQASARAIRIGQNKKVNVLRFISSSTIEEEIVKLHDHKKEITEDLLRGTSKASQLTVEDLLKLIK